MKSRSFAPFAIVLAAAAAAPAFAQSSVTIYGRINETIENQKVGNGSSVWVEQNNSSRIGFQGTEDLGGGMKAGFTLEHGLNADTGAATGGTTFWSRRSEVNLVSSSLGTSGVLFAHADTIALDPQGRLHTFCHTVPGKYHLMAGRCALRLRGERQQQGGLPLTDLQRHDL